ncbi:hypothetical protein CJ263_10665 [Maribacter cobaltidurans]|uniref:Uncharacterized protein n=2 Tax=Maribacter cobaltidurans TaxID=1178778 RepID=A0A223V609_9FLAO|nr:hypothetical protein CJ263_10665 [Maribacter cobaltidurans]GGD80469.1 hypothetical protein GCM10011412_17810 [Maribacter cobaltidurans]
MRFGNYVTSIELEPNTLLKVDFRDAKFLDPAEIVVLACSIEYLYTRFNCKVEFCGGFPSLNNHLDKIKFKHYWNPSFKRDNYTASKNNSTLCPWHISKNMIDQYGQQAQKYFKNTFFHNKDLQPLSQSLVEVFNNIFDHSESSIQGYVITQFYPSTEELTFAVCDFGKAIPTTINNYLHGKDNFELKHNVAIEKALERGMTIRSIPHNAGFGLTNVLEFAEDSNGKLTIFSNGGYFIKESKKEKKSGLLSYPFNGTLIIVKIDTTTLDDFDSDDEIYEF